MSTRRRVITGPDSTKDTAGTLDGKRALVIGGTRGMGAAIAELLAARNARVLVTARHPAAHCAVRLIQADLAAPGGADIVAGEAIRLLGGLDIMVHCVGAPFAKPGGALALTDEDWMDALNTNLLAAVRLDRAVLPAMIRQRSGVIVHVSSLQWKRPHQSSPAYGRGSPTELQQGPRHRGRPPRRASEHNHARLHRNPLAETRITQIMDQAALSRADAEEALLATIGGVPLGRPGTTAEVAQLAAFLASDAASYLTGAEFIIDGGNNPVI